MIANEDALMPLPPPSSWPGALMPAQRSRRARWARALRILAAVLGVMAGTGAIAVPTCTIASGATLAFGSIVALASTPDVTTNSGSSFWVNCTSDVTSAPTLFSSTERKLLSSFAELPFALSLGSPGATELPSTAPGTALTALIRNGTNQTVTLHGKVRAADFKALPSGVYARSITLTIEY